MMQMPLPQISWNITASAVVLAGAVVAAVWKITAVARMLVAPIREFVSEHDVLWEDYNLRTGGHYRRSTGRGEPPDPEEFYRDHPMAGKNDLRL